MENIPITRVPITKTMIAKIKIPIIFDGLIINNTKQKSNKVKVKADILFSVVNFLYLKIIKKRLFFKENNRWQMI